VIGGSSVLMIRSELISWHFDRSAAMNPTVIGLWATALIGMGTVIAGIVKFLFWLTDEVRKRRSESHGVISSSCSCVPYSHQPAALRRAYNLTKVGEFHASANGVRQMLTTKFRVWLQDPNIPPVWTGVKLVGGPQFVNAGCFEVTVEGNGHDLRRDGMQPQTRSETWKP